MALTPDQVRHMMLQVADAIIAAEPMLSKADRDLGDGDHGLGMKRGMEAVKAQLEPMAPASAEQVLVATGTAMMSSMGGASGAIFGTVYRAGGKAITGRPFDSESLALMLEAALEGVMKRGGAKPGDKTMIDALAPAAKAARAAISQPIGQALAAAAQGADEGTEASKAMIAQFGRAKTLGEACIGFPDAGACSVSVMLNTMSNYAATAA
jgi:phosphoenolpyruvate---glycerone phosphotransferase subunit DhaL